MSNATVCHGISATVGYNNDANTYVWSNGTTTGQITVTPTATTTYTVTATNVGTGCTATASVTVNVNQLPTVTIDSPGAICYGETATLTAQSPTAIHYNWNTGDATAAIDVTPTTTGAYIVKATDANGCTQIATIHLVVNPLPEATITGTSVICDGGSATLSAPAGAAMYYWETGSTDPSITVSPTITTVYTVTVTSVEGCSQTANFTVTVNPIPRVGITGQNIICFGATANITAAGGASYAWSNGANTALLSVAPTATTTYTVTVTNGFGCTATQSLTIIVNPLPVIVINGSTTICNGASTTLTATGGATYLWNNSTTTATQTLTPVATTTYLVTVTTAAGCSASQSVTVTVNPTPTATISGTLILCNGNSTTLTVATDATPATYAWSNSANTAAVTVSPTANTIYTVTVTNQYGCTSTAKAVVRVNAVPVVTFINATPITICQGACTPICATPNLGTYVWNTGETATTITACPTTTTIYTVTITNAAGCTASGTMTVNVNALPTPVITGQTTACSNSSVTLTATGGATYTWSNGATTNVINVTVVNTTTYIVTATNTNGCTAMTSYTVTVNPRPIVTASCLNHDVCLGGTISLNTTTNAANTTAWTYAWSGPNGFTAATQGASIPNASLANTGAYVVTVTNEFGCTSTSVVNVTVAPCDNQITGTVWEDANHDGANQTATTENEVAGMTVQLIDASNNVVATQVTDAFGDYTFTFVNPGVYTVKFVNLPGYVFTTQNTGTPNGSDANQNTGIAGPITVNPGSSVSSIDAGIFNGVSTIGDFVWNDINGNGVQDGEPAVAGVDVQLLDGTGAVLQTTTTGINGDYHFTVAPGIYAVNFYKPGWTLTTQTLGTTNGSDADPATGHTPNFVVGTGQTITDIDAGFAICTCRSAQHISSFIEGVSASTNETDETPATTSQIGDLNNLRISRASMGIYPNPNSTGELTVKVNTTIEDTEATIIITDIMGKMIIVQRAVLASGTNYVKVDVNTLQAGTFFVKVRANGVHLDAQKLVRILD
jgi:hypothetical protein